jgi:hypothetical protein
MARDRTNRHWPTAREAFRNSRATAATPSTKARTIRPSATSALLVVDAEAYEVTDTIEPLDVNGVALLDGSLWVTHETFNVAQRFDLPT